MIKLFTHNDLDGMGCILLAQLAFGTDAVHFDMCNYEDINDKVALYIESKDYLNYDHCFITDISITEALASSIDTLMQSHKEDDALLAHHFQLIDHHISATYLTPYTWCLVKVTDENDIKCSGTSLFYNFLCQSNILDDTKLTLLKAPLTAEFVEKVRRYDTWDWQALEDLKAKQLNDLVYILGKERFMSYWATYLIEGPSQFEFDETQLLLLELRQNEIDKYIEARDEELVVKEILGYQAGVVFANRFQSELGNKLAELHPELDFIAMINVGGGVSCRTIKEDINLATDIAEVFGGGGHAKAAGLPVPSEIRELVINTLFHLEN